LILVFYYNRDFIFSEILRKFVLVFAIFYILLFSCFPLYKIAENPEYYRILNYSLDYLKDETNEARSNKAKIYVERDLAFGIFDYYYGRMYLYEYQDYFIDKPKINLERGDKIYIFRKSELDRFISDPSFVLATTSVEINEIQRPVKGLLTFGKSRSDSIGFWEIGLKE
jgi:hypothetical protein